MDAKVFGAYIASLRKEKHMTQSQVAEKIHVTDKAVSKWERGLGIPDINNMEALAEALDVTIAELIQCKKQEDAFIKPEEVSSILGKTFDIVEYQKQIIRKRIIWGLIAAAIGAILVFAGIHYLILPGVVIGGGDGPTAIFIAGRISNSIPITVIIVGCIVLMIGLWRIFRN